MSERKPTPFHLTLTLSRYFFHASSHRRYAVSSWIFIRILALIYTVVFLSIAGNALSWIGSHGDFPVKQTLKEAIPIYEVGAMVKYPTLFWYSTSDMVVMALPLIAAGFSLLLLIGLQPAGLLSALYICLLSFTSVAGPYLSSPAYHLLLEVGFLSSFLSSFQFWMPFRRSPDPPRIIRLLILWLFFRALLSPFIFWILEGGSTYTALTYLLYFVLMISMSLFFLSDFFWAGLFQRDQEFISHLGGNKHRGFSKTICILVGILVLSLSLLALYDHFSFISQRANGIRIFLAIFKPFGLTNLYR